MSLLLPASKCLSLIAGIHAVGGLSVTDLYVSPSGNDSNPGTANRPFASLRRARDAARRFSSPNRTIHVAPGRYFLNESLQLDDRDSHETWRGTGKKATAEIYGGLPITHWIRWKGNIWRAVVPKGKRFFNLIVDGQSATMAQVPKLGSGFGGGARRVNNQVIGLPPAWQGYDYTDAQVFAFIGDNWFSEMREVRSRHPNRDGTLPIDGGSNQFGGMNDRFYLRGLLEFLTEPGEWCLRSSEGFVYYWPKVGTPADHLIVRPTAERLLDVHGVSERRPAKNVTFENLSFIGSDFCSRWFLFVQPNDGSTPDRLQQGMIFGENVQGLAVRRCKLLAAGHSAVWLNKSAQNCQIEDNLILGAGFAGVYLNGWTLGQGPFHNAVDSYVNKGHRIAGNFIYDCGKFVAGGCGIQVYQSGDNLIARNEIGKMPRYGISCKGERYGCLPKTLYSTKMTFNNQFDFLHTRRNQIVGNEIYSVCRNSFDFGALESWGVGRDNLWADNDLHDIDQTLDWDGWAHVLFADDACHYLTIRGNIIHHCYGGKATGAFMLKNIEEVIEDNVVVDCGIGRLITFEPYMEPCWNVTVRRNVFAADGVNSRYGDLNEYSFKGKSYLDVAVPAGASGFREVDHNFIAPSNTSSPNPNAIHGMDLRSIFDSHLLTRNAPEWQATRFDYKLKPMPGLRFQSSSLTQMGLPKDFPFDRFQATRRLAAEKIQAEDYQRMHELRTQGGLGIYGMSRGSWAKYSNIDFGSGKAKSAEFQFEAALQPAQQDVLAELRLGSPEGPIIGTLSKGYRTSHVRCVQGIHDLYLTFSGKGIKSLDWFRFL